MNRQKGRKGESGSLKARLLAAVQVEGREHQKCSPHIEQYLPNVSGTDCVTQARDATGVSLQGRNSLPAAEESDRSWGQPQSTQCSHWLSSSRQSWVLLTGSINSISPHPISENPESIQGHQLGTVEEDKDWKQGCYTDPRPVHESGWKERPSLSPNRATGPKERGGIVP